MYNSINITTSDDVYAYAFESSKGETIVNFMVTQEGDDHSSLTLGIPFKVALDMAAQAAKAVADNAQYQARQAELEQAAKDALDKAADAVYGEQVPA